MRNRPMPKIVRTAAELKPHDRYCTCCERELTGAVAWLELDQRNDTYHDREDVPPEHSQGWVPFGLKCARKLLAKSVEAS